jgi:hypothetical protein
MQDFATDFGGFLDVMDPTHRLWTPPLLHAFW